MGFMQFKTILSAFVRPIKEKLPFFCLFLIATDAIPLRLFVSNIHYRNFGAIGDFLLEDFPRAGVIAYLATLAVYFFRKKWVLMGGYVLATILLAVCLFLHLVFGKTLQPDIVTLILETNSQESSEFISSFLFTKGGIATIVICLLYVALAIVCERRKSNLVVFQKANYKTILSLVLGVYMILGILSFSFYKTVLIAKTVDVLPNHDGKYDALSSVFYSLYSIRLINVEMKQAVEVTKNIKSSSVALQDKDSLYVVYVIGESYIKRHAQLYGYYLQTTPNLCNEERKGNLFVFDNVVTPFNQTTLVMKNTFCCNSLVDGEKWSHSPYFPAIFKKAGFDVYFWDAQKSDDPKAQGLNNFSMYSFYYNEYFMNHVYKQVSQKTFKYDNDVIDDFEKVQMKGKYNLIMFHLMGQHVVCTNRYPKIKQFNKFDSNSILSKKSYLDASKKQEIAEYDNATFYNDYALEHIFDMFRNKNAVVLYFSDHGEEVYDYRDSRGRMEMEPKMLKEGVQCQYEVPFMIWCSDEYIQKHPQKIEEIKAALHQPFQTDNLCYVMFNIAGITTSVYKPTRDILNPQNQRKDRIVGGKYNYDKIMQSMK